MSKSIVRCFLSLFVSALVAHAAYAEGSATFTLATPCYYVDDLLVWGNPSFVSGKRGSFTSFESFKSKATYYCESDSGYHVAKWVLRTAGLSGNKTIKTWENTSSIKIEFDYKWAAKYGTSLELVVYVAQFNYTLSYDANGGTWTAGEPKGGTYGYAKGGTAPEADSVANGDRELKGWQSSGGSLIEPGESFTGEDLNVTSDGQKVVLYAQWGAAEYEVTLAVPEGASVKGLAKVSSDEDWDYFKTTYVAGKGLTLPKATTTKAGSKFLAWYDNPNFVEDTESKLYSKVTKIGKDETGDKEYYAKFETKLAIHYDGNGASKGTMTDQSFVSGEAVSLSECRYTKVYTVKFNANGGSGKYENETAEYTFSHWNTEKDGTGDSYEDGQSVTFNATEAFTLHAQWEPATVAITLPDAPTWSGHVFSGWYTAQKGGTCVGYDGDPYEPTGNITLYARWDGAGDLAEAVGLTKAELTTWCAKKASYKGTDNVWHIEGNGSSGKQEDPCLELSYNGDVGATSILAMNVTGPGVVTFKVCATIAQPLVFFNGISNETITVIPEYKELMPKEHVLVWTNITREVGTGVIQVKWSVSSPNNPIWLDDISWNPDKGDYTITAAPSDWAGGTVTGGGTYISGETATLRAKPKTGWKFIRWDQIFRDDSGKVVSNKVDVSRANPYQVTVATNAEYSAILADEWYYISYNKNGGTGTMDKQLAVRDEDTKLTANAFTRANYTFAGWNTAKDGSGTAYADKADNVRNLALSGSTVTLYAIWKSGSDPEPGPEPTPTPEPGPYASSVGEAVSVDLAADCKGYTIKSVSGLPTGLKFSKTTGLVTGTPTKAVSKADNVTITFTDKTKVTTTWTVEALPEKMVGTYYGAATVGGIAGQFLLKLTATGKATGYFYAAGKKISFKSTALDEADGCYVATVSYTYNKTKYPDEKIVLAKAAAVKGEHIWSADVSDSKVLEEIDARRDTIKEVFDKVVSKTATYPVLEKTGEGEFLTAKVTTAGAVTVSGKLLSDADKLTSVSCSTHLVVDDEGAACCRITIYKTASNSEPIVYDELWYLPVAN